MNETSRVSTGQDGDVLVVVGLLCSLEFCACSWFLDSGADNLSVHFRSGSFKGDLAQAPDDNLRRAGSGLQLLFPLALVSFHLAQATRWRYLKVRCFCILTTLDRLFSDLNVAYDLLTLPHLGGH